MKKLILPLCFVLLVSLFAGCGMKKDMEEEMQDMKMTALEAHKWEFSYGQQGSDGDVFIRSEKNEEHKDVKTADIAFLVDKGYLVIKDNKDKKEWEIDYKMVSENPESTVYELNYKDGEDELKGMATVTNETDDKGEDSLVITLGDYTLWFYA